MLFRSYNYSELIFIEFKDNSYKDYSGSFEVRLLENKKIKTFSFTGNFAAKEAVRLADVLVEKKVAVKLNSLEY